MKQQQYSNSDHQLFVIALIVVGCIVIGLIGLGVKIAQHRHCEGRSASMQCSDLNGYHPRLVRPDK